MSQFQSFGGGEKELSRDDFAFESGSFFDESNSPSMNNTVSNRVTFDNEYDILTMAECGFSSVDTDHGNYIHNLGVIDFETNESENFVGMTVAFQTDTPDEGGTVEWFVSGILAEQ